MKRVAVKYVLQNVFQISETMVFCSNSKALCIMNYSIFYSHSAISSRKTCDFFFSQADKKKTVWGETSVSETPLATRSHNDYGCCTKGNLLRESPMSGEIFTGHIKREVKLPKSVLSSRRPLLMTGHWNNPQRTWRNAENAACLLSCEIGGYLKRRFKAWLMYAMPRVISSARHYFWRFYGVSESCTVPTRPRCSCVDWKKTLNLLTWDFIGGIFLRSSALSQLQYSPTIPYSG